MTTPEHLWLGAIDDEWEPAVWFDPDEGGTEYIRRDPAVLAALPEVQALIRAETERCAGIAEHFRDMCGECHWPEDAVIAGGNVANDIAAAIREGRA